MQETSGTWLWRKWLDLYCSHVVMLAMAVMQQCLTQISQVTKMDASSGSLVVIFCVHLSISGYLMFFFVCEAAELLCEIEHQFIYIYGH